METKREILLVNDDGIASKGLTELSRMAKELGDVLVVAPSGQRSAMSQRISVFGSIEVHPVPDYPVEGIRAFTISGTPADCVKVALNCLLDTKPDVVFSGINNGYNVGTDILYSGTIGAAAEALVNGIPAIAFSAKECEDLRITRKYLPGIAQKLLDIETDPWELWNVNFPSGDPALLSGILTNRFPSRNQYYRNVYTWEKEEERKNLLLSSVLCAAGEPGSDMQAVLDGYISIGRVCCALLKPT